MIKTVLARAGKKLIGLSGYPVIANMNVISCEAQSLDGHEVAMVNCYQMGIDRSVPGYFRVSEDGSVFSMEQPDSEDSDYMMGRGGNFNRPY